MKKDSTTFCLQVGLYCISLSCSSYMQVLRSWNSSFSELFGFLIWLFTCGTACTDTTNSYLGSRPLHATAAWTYTTRDWVNDFNTKCKKVQSECKIWFHGSLNSPWFQAQISSNEIVRVFMSELWTDRDAIMYFLFFYGLYKCMESTYIMQTS